MKRIRTQRGSALLIVLGMLSFLTVSAMGFAVYMRQGRKPSAQLHQAVSARQLLKSALANAICRLDGCLGVNGNGETFCEGIYDDVYPGVGPSSRQPFTVADNAEGSNGDWWDHRVFTPFGPIRDESRTVSTLTMEALAYLPPALINEVRVFSRHTQTAIWRNLAFDVGRYAFCAVDVSDLFDINKVRADSRRTSLSGSRISLASLFDTGTAENLGALLAKGDNLVGRFLSLADYNVVAGRGSPFSPFCRYVGTGGAAIYSQYDDQDVKCISNALFITDTWFPPTNVLGMVQRKVYNLEGGRDADQPWTEYNAGSLQEMLDGTANQNTIGDPLFKALQGVGLACLYDYLDNDSIPLSYCLPCTETAPMICGLGLNADPDIQVALVPVQTLAGKVGTPDQQTGKYSHEIEAIKYALKITVGQVEVNGLMAFPFKRVGAKGETYKLNYGGKAMVKLFFGATEMSSRLTLDDTTRALAPETGKKWEDGATGWKNGVCTMVADSVVGNLKFGNVETQNDAVHEFHAQPVGPSGDHQMPVFWVVTKYKCNSDGQRGDPEANWYSLDGMKDEADVFCLRDKNGAPDEKWTKLLDEAAPAMPQPVGNVWPSEPTKATTGDASGALLNVDFVPHLAVWMRLEDTDEDRAVDVVPARPEDDEVYGDYTASQQSFWTDATGDGQMLPLLEFRGADALQLNHSTLQTRFPEAGGGPPLEFGRWKKLYAVDPRYNFAPENWFAMSGNSLSAAEWLDYVKEFMGADADRDQDIFMFTSDQEFLQSIGELAFLPFVCEINHGGNGVNHWYTINLEFHGKDLADRVPGGNGIKDLDFSHKDLMWRTYTAVPRKENGWVDDIYALQDSSGNPVDIVSGQNDFRVNPYSRDIRILESVVRGTPFDYYVANVGPYNKFKETDNQKKKKAAEIELAKPSESKAYEFGPNSTVATMSDQELSAIAAKFSEFLTKNSADGGSWLAALNQPYWYNDPEKKGIRFFSWYDGERGDAQRSFMDVELSKPLHGVDRKFLYSYWRECFQNRQQLFLVFIRAEPLTVGSIGIGSLANTQLGVRGVALVWRDPEPPLLNRDRRKQRKNLKTRAMWREMLQDGNVGPNRTRVLFYHQFD